MRHTTAILVGLLVAGCNKDEIVWVQFNEDGQSLQIEVGPPITPCALEQTPTAIATIDPACQIELKSNLGLTPVGTATIDPLAGPVGTEHQVSVIVFDEFESLVGRATVVVETEAVSDLDDDGEPDSRGEGEFDLERDSADVGAYALMLQSLGAEGEERTDTFTIRLYEPQELAEQPE